MRTFPLLLALGLSIFSMNAQEQQVIRLWEGDAPGARGQEDKDIPTLTVYLPEKKEATGAAVVVFPGGGYAMLAQHEGKDYALWLAEHGIAGFVLKYRLGSNGYRHPAMLQDAARAVRTVRARSSEWQIDPERIGVMGSSAGGHLASTILTHFDEGQPNATDPVERVSSRPTLGILCYPVITLSDKGHRGSKHNLLGENPSPELVKLLSNELQVTSNTPPTFLWHTWEDKGVPPDNSLLFAQALQNAGVPYSLHIFEKGRHGIGLANGHPWTQDCLFWLKARGFLR